MFLFLTLERRRLDGERRSAAGAILCRAGESHRVFVVGNEADDLELVLRRRRIAAARRTGKGSHFGGISEFLTAGDLVSDGYGICRCKTHVATQGVGTKGIGFDKRGSFVVVACSVLGIELFFDGSLFLDVVGRDNLIVDLLLLVSESVVRVRHIVRIGSGSRAACKSRVRQRQRARRHARKGSTTRERPAAFVTRSHVVTIEEFHRCRFLHISGHLPSSVQFMTRSLTNAP